MKPTLIVVATVLLLSGCDAHKTAATNAAQGASGAAGSNVTPTRTSPKQRQDVPGRGPAKQSAALIENERGVDPNQSALKVRIHE